MTFSAPGASGQAEVLNRLSELLKTPPGQPPANHDLAAFQQARAECDDATLDAAMATHLAGIDVNPSAAIRLLHDIAAKRLFIWVVAERPFSSASTNVTAYNGRRLQPHQDFRNSR